MIKKKSRCCCCCYKVALIVYKKSVNVIHSQSGLHVCLSSSPISYNCLLKRAK